MLLNYPQIRLTIVMAENKEELENAIRLNCQIGWKPVGEIYLYSSMRCKMLSQIMAAGVPDEPFVFKSE